MELVREIVGLLVIAIGLVEWVVFLPQIRVLYKVKKAEEFSLLTLWASLVMQAIILTHILLQPTVDWKISITYFTGIICFVVFLALVHYYRCWPGGRGKPTTNRG